LSHINLEDVLIFILPGGYLWEGSYPATEIHPFLARLEKAKIPMAAICAATTVFAKAGVLAGKKHTSNSREYIAKMVSGYSEGKNYVDSPATRDQHVITACGLGPVDFAMEVLNELELATPELRIVWYAAFKNGKYPDNVQHSA
jgi:putative intracellular protease/amidase